MRLLVIFIFISGLLAFQPTVPVARLTTQIPSLLEQSDVPVTGDVVSRRKSFFIETHGCAMNLADSDIVRSVLSSAGYDPCEVLEQADLILTNTCAIRDNAEAKVYHRLKYFNSLRKKNRKTGAKPNGYPLVGLLGCMAERLKSKLLDDESLNINFIAGPDAYRNLPNLLLAASTDQRAASTQLSLEETYADIAPVRLAEGNTHAFVTITRGCNNMCSFCIVPYTRGRERSRSSSSIVSEVCSLREQGFKEVVLLGQNVNSYFDRGGGGGDDEEGPEAAQVPNLAEGFTQKWRPRTPTVIVPGATGVSFGELLERVSAVDPEMRVRFQAPHPKDFPDDVLRLIGASPNICSALHMPAQHGSSAVLARMHRGYTREAYLALVGRAREMLGRGSPEGVGMGLSSDFISGFCGETEDEHLEMMSLVSEVGFDQAFTYSYSRREQTYAGLFYQDDVPEATKARRLAELVDTFQQSAQARNNRLELGRLHCVLVEGEAKRPGQWTGRTDSNKRVVFSDAVVLDGLGADEAAALALAPATHSSVEACVTDLLSRRGGAAPSALAAGLGRQAGRVTKGSILVVKVLSAKGHTLRGAAVALSTLGQAFALNLPALPTS